MENNNILLNGKKVDSFNRIKKSESEVIYTIQEIDRLEGGIEAAHSDYYDYPDSVDFDFKQAYNDLEALKKRLNYFKRQGRA